jgi:hypothetical protein
VYDEGPDGRGLPIALICPERRLRLVLRLALEGVGYDVLDWSSAPSERQGNDVVAAVVDLDSSRLRPETVVDRLSTWGLPGATPLLLISVYPRDCGNVQREAPTEYLQPPFAPRELVCHLARLLTGARSRQASQSDGCSARAR